MRIGIVTIDDYTNYGNRLQNFALTKLLKNEGIDVINGIRVYTKEDWIGDTNSMLKRIIKKVIPMFVLKNRLYNDQEPKDRKLSTRQQRFMEFIQSYTAIVDPIIATSHKKASSILNDYKIDYYITGSDQVWNPYYEGKHYEFLTFAQKNKRYSFAASIGAEDIPEEKKTCYRKYLQDMTYLSVREEKAAEIIKDLTGRKADITLDPTLLLSQKEWEKVVKKPNLQLEEKYICTYFLGIMPEAVEKYANEKQLKVYHLNSKSEEELFCIDPAEFLYMIRNAECVLTDSFHAVAFSIKFHKDFYVFKREQEGVNNMFSRIETITKRFGLEYRIQDRKQIEECDSNVDWDEIENELCVERKKSIKKILNMMEK